MSKLKFIVISENGYQVIMVYADGTYINVMVQEYALPMALAWNIADPNHTEREWWGDWGSIYEVQS